MSLRDYLFHEEPGITLYCGDCREVLPLLEYDRVITDQPYGTGWVSGGGRVAGKFYAEGQSACWDRWSLEWLKLVQAETIAMFCPNSRLRDLLSAVPSYSLRFYVKSNPRPACQATDAPSVEPIVITPKLPYGDGPQHLTWYNAHETEHPTEKPYRVMTWLMAGCSLPGDVVCDPFAGSGTTILAAKNLGRRAIGIEIEPKYCEIAVKRLRQEVLPLT